MLMQRGHNNTVTKLPILIPATQGREEGFATFESELQIQPVRALSNGDLKGASSAMRPEEAKHFYAVTMLTQALGANPDRLAIKRATDLLREAYDLKKKERGPLFTLNESEQSQVGSVLTGLMGLPAKKAEQALQVLEGLRPGPQASKNVRWLLSYEISEALRDARLVLWWTGRAFQPAIWCPTLQTAFYARALLAVVGVTGFRVCPYCGEPFFQKRSDQDYCKIPHREAHRVARWRSRQKSKGPKNKKKRRRNGSHQTG
jgi:hypothetical protein